MLRENRFVARWVPVKYNNQQQQQQQQQHEQQQQQQQFFNLKLISWCVHSMLKV